MPVNTVTPPSQVPISRRNKNLQNRLGCLQTEGNMKRRKFNHESNTTHESHEHHRADRPDTPSRRFPQEEYYEPGDNTGNIEVVGLKGFTHVRCHRASQRACHCGRYACHINSMIIAVDGACPGNGSDKAVMSACGVYFGPLEDFDTDQQNWSWRVRNKPGYAHTSQRAELHAALGALCAAEQYATEGGQWRCEPPECLSPCRINHIVIKSDSAYLVNAMTSSIKKWQLNGWQTAKNTPVKNRDLWEEMIRRVQELADLDTTVDFWLVPREMNKEADKLANVGLGSDFGF